MMQNSEKIILDLCGGTGSWSKSYRDAGYDVRVVTLPEHNVMEYTPPLWCVRHLGCADLHTVFSRAHHRQNTARPSRRYGVGEPLSLDNPRMPLCRDAQILGAGKPCGILAAVFRQAASDLATVRLRRPAHQENGLVGLLQHATKEARCAHAGAVGRMRHKQPRAAGDTRRLRLPARHRTPSGTPKHDAARVRKSLFPR